MHAVVTQYCYTCRKQTGYGANTEPLFLMHWKQSVSVLLNLNVSTALETTCKIAGLVFTSCVGHLLGRKKCECNTSSAKIH